MTQETDILDFLRARFGRVDDALATVNLRLGELTARVGRLERSVADFHVQMADHSIRFDRIGGDVEQIKRRLGLVDAS